MAIGVTLALAGIAMPLVEERSGDRRRALVVGGVLAVLGAALLLVPLPFSDDRTSLRIGLLLGGLVWCGPAADLLVRWVLDATRLPAPEAAAEAGLRAGRWIGRLERWLLLGCVAAGQPTLAVLPIGGKALFRYAEVVADARADAPRLERPDDVDAPVTRSTLIDYVIVGSLASWVQAIGLGLLTRT